MENTIKVTGRSKVSAAPDTTRIVFDLNGWKEAYDETLALFNGQFASLQKKLKSCGFTKEDLKTTHYSLSVKNENYRDKDGNYRTKQVGYEFYHTLKIEFSSDGKRLNRILTALSKDGAAPDFRIEYTVSDPESVKKKLIAAAVKDAKEKAEVLAEAAGQKLGGVISINYAYGEDDMTVRPMERAKLCANGACDTMSVNFTPEDIVIEDTVSVIFAF